MKYSMVFAAAAATVAQADCTNENGNFFCKAVKALQYEGIDLGGNYKAVTSMTADGKCDFSDVAFSGSIAPFDEDLSIHIRGPATVEKMAVYTPKTNSKRDAAPVPHTKRHGHQHLHKKFHEHQHEERAVGDKVDAVINGQAVSWTNTWDGKSGDNKPAAAASPPAAPAVNAASTYVKSENPASKVDVPKVDSKLASSKIAAPKKADTSSVATGDYARVGYYDATSNQATGLTFTGNYGGSGSGSGVWDTTWGNSLSYLNEDATGGAPSPTVLKGGKIPDGSEIAIFSDKACTDSGASCGFYRPGTVAYEGFKGADKVFTFKVTMPKTGATGFNKDMPAIWLLNGKIPYHDCSCWKSGCGEFDLIETLASGDSKCKSTFHYTNSIGNSDYLQRPELGFVNYAVIFSKAHASASIKILDDDFDHSAGLTADQVEKMIVDDAKTPGGVSKMAIPANV
ncbi:uncharacterized protein PG998_010946 [Apiospora kogelbergensis]|uniref:uncharacterized protein n=1 Tax=Apiospora kogelbergensis TaxID=1337665 RepID=UPI003131A38D